MGELVKMSKNIPTVYLVNHTHWDREWYFSGQDSIILSDLLFTSAIKELEAHPKMKFVLDGQISILDDYLNVRPELLSKIKQLVADDQLQIGPWYTQSDALHVKGESLLRNGIIGQLKTQKYGSRMKVGYLPDTFGFNSQLPVILNELGLDNFVFWRGIDPNKTDGFYFNWQSLSGSKNVTAINMPQGYGTGMLLEPSHHYVDYRLDPAVNFIEKHSANFEKDVLIPTGNDQMDIIHDFESKVAQINKIGKYKYKIDDYAGFVKKIQRKDLSNYVGEFLDPIFARIHRSCGSSRMNIKLAVSHLETKLIHEVEPVMVIGKACGIDLSTGVLVAAWEKLLKSQAHDSLAGSVVDSVADDIMHRLKEGEELADSIINTVQRMISRQLKLTTNQVLLLNPLPEKRVDFQKVHVITSQKYIEFDDVQECYQLKQSYVKERKNVLKEVPGGTEEVTEAGYYVTDYLIKTELPSMGYKIISFHSVENELKPEIQDELKISDSKVEISFRNQNLILSRSHGEKIENFLFLEDRGNAGDTYDFSPLPKDEKITLHFESGKVVKNNHFQQLILKGSTLLPFSLEDRRLHKYNKQFRYTVKLTLLELGQIDVQINFDNTIEDHQLTLGINTGAKENARASVPFGYLTRNSEKNVSWQKKYAERPINYWPLDNNVSVTDEPNQNISVFTDDVKEYRQHNGQLLFTMLATTDQLGKPNLVNRPGRASGDTTKLGHPLIAAPKAELFQEFQFNFHICLTDHFDELATAKKSVQFLSSVLSYQVQELNLFENRLDNKLQDSLVPDKKLPVKLSLLKIPNDLVISACYPDYFDEDAVIVRVTNPTKDTVSFNLPRGVKVVDAVDEPKEFEGKVDPYDILTLKYVTTDKLMNME